MRNHLFFSIDFSLFPLLISPKSNRACVFVFFNVYHFTLSEGRRLRWLSVTAPVFLHWLHWWLVFAESTKKLIFLFFCFNFWLKHKILLYPHLATPYICYIVKMIDTRHFTKVSKNNYFLIFSFKKIFFKFYVIILILIMNGRNKETYVCDTLYRTDERFKINNNGGS